MYRDGQGRDGGFSRIVGMDPAADWLFGPALRDFLPPGGRDVVVPFLLRVDDEAALRVVEELHSLTPPPLRVLSLYRRPDRGLRVGEPVVALAPLGFFEELAAGRNGLEPLRSSAKRIKLGLPFPAAAVLAPGPDSSTISLDPPPICPREKWPDGTVVIGIIDDGIAFAHQRFRTADSATRFEAFWNQAGEPPSSTVDYGIELGRAQIDNLLGTSVVAGLTDEDAVYRRAGLIDRTRQEHAPAAWRAAHGTHVLDLMAGSEPGEPSSLNRPIIGVQLRVASTEKQSGTDIGTDVISAFAYILDRARRLTAPGCPLLPVVINFSFANHGGPHDGTSLMEETIEKAIKDARDTEGREVRVVLPAGNTHLSRCHAAFTFRKMGETIELPLRVQPDDRTLSAVEIWLPSSGGAAPSSSRISLSLSTPDGIQRAQIAETVGVPVVFPDGPTGPKIFGSISYNFELPETSRGHFSIDLMPTSRLLLDPDPDAGHVAPAGLWTIRLTNVSLTPEDRIEVWIERDDLRYGYPRRGRQSYFEKACYQRFDDQGRELADPPLPPCEVKRPGMISGIATGRSPVVAGGMLRKELRAASYSAGGPVVTPEGGPSRANERKPDILMVSEDSQVHAGVLAAGARSGSVVAMSGTSVAAPQLARWVADQLAQGDPSDRNAVIAEAEVEEAALPPPEAPPPPDGPADLRSGWGRAPGISTHAGAGRRYWWP